MELSISELLARAQLHADQPAPQAPEFSPVFESCDRHGRFQINLRDGNGVERWLPGCGACAAESKSSILTNRSGIPERFRDRELSSYQADTPAQSEALKISQSFADTFAAVAAKRGTCLTFFGKPGTGKTHLACGIAHQLIRSGHSALFVNVADAIRAVRATWVRDSKKTEEQVLEGFAAVDLLIIDEVGVQSGTDSEQNTLFEIINRRYAALKPMIILTNLPVRASVAGQRTLRDYLGDRSFDRLREGGGKFVSFDWESYRKRVM